MGSRGPVPKRSSARLGHSKKEKVDSVAPVTATVAMPKANSRWHPIARDWFNSLAESGQSQYFEPSDWQAARYVGDVMSRNLKQTSRFSAVLFQAVWSAMNDLLTTEGARRRVRMEIERGDPAAQAASVTALADYRKTLGA